MRRLTSFVGFSDVNYRRALRLSEQERDLAEDITYYRLSIGRHDTGTGEPGGMVERNRAMLAKARTHQAALLSQLGEIICSEDAGEGDVAVIGRHEYSIDLMGVAVYLGPAECPEDHDEVAEWTSHYNAAVSVN